MLREREGRWWLHYDPALAVPVRALTDHAAAADAKKIVSDGEAALWALYDAITARTLLLRGADPQMQDEFGHTAWMAALNRAIDDADFARQKMAALFA